MAFSSLPSEKKHPVICIELFFSQVLSVFILGVFGGDFPPSPLILYWRVGGTLIARAPGDHFSAH